MIPTFPTSHWAPSISLSCILSLPYLWRWSGHHTVNPMPRGHSWAQRTLCCAEDWSGVGHLQGKCFSPVQSLWAFPGLYSSACMPLEEMEIIIKGSGIQGESRRDGERDSDWKKNNRNPRTSAPLQHAAVFLISAGSPKPVRDQHMKNHLLWKTYELFYREVQQDAPERS